MIARLLRQLGVLLAAALLPALVSGAVQLQWRDDTPPVRGEVSASTIRAWGEPVLWVDARSRAKFEREHLPGAVLLNEDEWETLIAPFLEAWDPDRKVVVYCDGGRCEASAAVAERLRSELKLPDVYVLEGGWRAWAGE